jgi:hypothetical protein
VALVAEEVEKGLADFCAGFHRGFIVENRFGMSTGYDDGAAHYPRPRCDTTTVHGGTDAVFIPAKTGIQ